MSAGDERVRQRERAAATGEPVRVAELVAEVRRRVVLCHVCGDEPAELFGEDSATGEPACEVCDDDARATGWGFAECNTCGDEVECSGSMRAGEVFSDSCTACGEAREFTVTS